MPPGADGFTTGLVLAAGGSTRLGRPKQLLPYRGATLLDWVLRTARACQFDQLVVALGGSAAEVGERVDLSGTRVVVNRAYGTGCSSSIAAGMDALDERCETLVLLLGDQPGVTAEAVAALRAGRAGAPLAVTLYDDGPGHPFAFGREVFGELHELHGDKGVWKLLDRRRDEVAEVRVPGTVPPDIDTWDDYQALIGAAARA